MSHLLAILPHLALGGADKFILDLLRQLTARGWQATIVTTRLSTHSWRVVFADVCPDIVDLASFPAVEQPARLVQIARDRAVDTVLLSNSALGYQLLPYLRAHLPGVVFVDYCHMEEEQAEGGYPGMSVRSAELLDLQVVSSEHLRRWMMARGADGEYIRVCTTNVDADDWNAERYNRAAIRRTLGIEAHVPVILYAGRLERQKQPLLALAVMRDVVRRYPQTVFLIAGDGQFAPFVRGFVRGNRLERNVRYLGAQANERVRELLAASDILFLPSEMEGISLAIYEAMAMGVVPVSAAVGGQSELVTPDVGVLVARGSGERAGYLDALSSLLADAARLHVMGHAARDRVRTHFRLDQMGERMALLLSEARRHHDGRPRPANGAQAAGESARAAVALAQAGVAEDTRINHPLRRTARQGFWWLVERGAWWLVPALERLRTDVTR